MVIQPFKLALVGPANSSRNTDYVLNTIGLCFFWQQPTIVDVILNRRG